MFVKFVFLISMFYHIHDIHYWKHTLLELFSYLYLHKKHRADLVGRAFASPAGDWGWIPGHDGPKLLKQEVADPQQRLGKESPGTLEMTMAAPCYSRCYPLKNRQCSMVGSAEYMTKLNFIGNGDVSILLIISSGIKKNQLNKQPKQTISLCLQTWVTQYKTF